MSDSVLIPIAHRFVEWLLLPTIGLLLALVVMAVWELGVLVGERCWRLRTIRHRGDVQLLEHYGRLRIERADILARVAPMLGLMGTLIPLGPGIAALSRGEFEDPLSAMSNLVDIMLVFACGLIAAIAPADFPSLARYY